MPNITVYVIPSKTNPRCYDIEIHGEKGYCYRDWDFGSLKLAKKYGISIAKNLGCLNPKVIIEGDICGV